MHDVIQLSGSDISQDNAAWIQQTKVMENAMLHKMAEELSHSQLRRIGMAKECVLQIPDTHTAPGFAATIMVCGAHHAPCEAKTHRASASPGRVWCHSVDWEGNLRMPATKPWRRPFFML